MKSDVKILCLSFIIAIFITLIASTSIYAAKTKSLTLVKIDDSYVAYIEDLEDTFRYAYSDTLNNEPSNFDVSSVDENGINVVLITNNDIDYIRANPYIWIKDNDNNVILKQKINLEDCITKNDILDINELTKKIKVNTEKISKNVKDSNEKIVTITTGKTDIVDDSTKEYDYSLIKVGSGNSTADNLVDAINSIKSSEKKSNYELINCYKKLRDLYNNLVENSTWQKVEDMSILQPETSFNDDVYVLLIRQKENGDVLKDDIQVLTCKRQEDSGVQEIKNVREVEKAVKLPVTGENIVLIGGFLAVVVAIVMTLIVKKKLNKEAK